MGTLDVEFLSDEKKTSLANVRLSFKNIKPETLSAQAMMGIPTNRVFDGPVTR